MAGQWRLVEGKAGTLRVYVTPDAGPNPSPGSVLMLCHELPRDPGGATDAGRGYPALADRLSDECGSRVIVGMLRGSGGSGGNFSAAGWLEDLETVAAAVSEPDEAIWLVGFGLGGAMALRAATRNARVCGVASVAGPADLSAWAARQTSVLVRCRRSGVISTPRFPADPVAWAAELVTLAPLEAAAALGSRPLLVIHGSEDAEVPAAAARALADAAARSPVDLRIVAGAGHWLRADPRVVATLVGWVERRR